MRPSLRSALTLTALTLLSACGQPGPTAPPVRVSDTYAPTPVPQRPGPQAQPAGLDPFAQQLVAQGLARLQRYRSIEGRLVFTEWEGGKMETGEGRLSLRQKPFAARVDVLKSNRFLATGTSILWEGGDQVQVKPLKMPLSLKFDTDDSKVVSLRGYRFDETDLTSMAKVMRHPAARLRYMGPRAVKGEALHLFEVFSPASAKGITREVIGLHQQHQIPTYREMYEGDRLVHVGQGVGLRLDGPVETDRFDL